jgi:hypothetical protein
VLTTCTSCRPMMVLTIGALGTFTRALGTYVPSFTAKPARLFFMLEAHGPQGAVRHVAAPELTSGKRRGPEPQGMWQR